MKIEAFIRFYKSNITYQNILYPKHALRKATTAAFNPAQLRAGTTTGSQGGVAADSVFETKKMAAVATALWSGNLASHQAFG